MVSITLGAGSCVHAVPFQYSQVMTGGSIDATSNFNVTLLFGFENAS